MDRPITERKGSYCKWKDLVAGLLKLTISSMEIGRPKPINSVIDSIKHWKKLRRNLLLYNGKGIMLSGGGAMLKGLDQLIYEEQEYLYYVKILWTVWHWAQAKFWKK